jgi:exopolysaccharide biosynthesis polyprenyl glycosylphosphotransferase
MSNWIGTNRTLLRLLLDAGLTALALYLAAVLSPAAAEAPLFPSTGLPALAYLLAVGTWLGAALLLSIYQLHDQRAVDEAQAILVTSLVSVVVLAAALFFVLPQISRPVVLLFYGLQLLFLAGSRLAIRLALRILDVPRYARRQVLILGAGDLGRDMMHMVERHRWTGLELAGFLDDHLPVGSNVEGYPILGPVRELEVQVHGLGIQEVILALPVDSYDRLFVLLATLQDLPAKVRIVPDHLKSFLFRTRLDEFASVPVITLQTAGLTPFERRIKRAFDLLVAAILTPVMAPLMAAIALAIRLDSPGPVLYRQPRVGENGKLFSMFKFRSMIQGAEEIERMPVSLSAGGEPIYKIRGDPRVTRVGKLLRRTSMDELPQLWNVVKGDMSMVGPRPELPWIVDRYEPWQQQRFLVPQGLTGWWQVNGRSDKPMHLHTEEDIFYIQNYSFFLDVRILWKTLGAVVKGRGAY